MDNTLLNHAAGFVVRAQGNSADGAMAQFHHSLKLSRLEPSTEDLAQALARAKRRWRFRDEILKFADVLPGSTSQWNRARKIVVILFTVLKKNSPSMAGDGFVPYYVIHMKHVV